MPGLIRLIYQNPQRSVSAVYSYRNKWQMRSIIMLWEKELEGKLNKYWIHVSPDLKIDPEIIKDIRFYGLNKKQK